MIENDIFFTITALQKTAQNQLQSAQKLIAREPQAHLTVVTNYDSYDITRTDHISIPVSPQLSELKLKHSHWEQVKGV